MFLFVLISEVLNNDNLISFKFLCKYIFLNPLIFVSLNSNTPDTLFKKLVFSKLFNLKYLIFKSLMIFLAIKYHLVSDIFADV